MQTLPYDLAERLISSLESGELGRDGRLPSFRSLAGHYACSVATIKRSVDMLQERKILHSIHGKGVFYAGKNFRPTRNAGRLLGAIVLDDKPGTFFGKIRTEYLSKGWVVASYNATDDFQDPAKEREFLALAERERFAGVLIAPTPIEPLNRDIFKKLRIAGMKLAITHPYAADMSGETYFCIDYKAAASLMVAQAAMRGYRNIAYFDNAVPSPYKILQKNGLEESIAALGLGSLIPLTCQQGEENKKFVWENAPGKEKLLQRLKDLPPNTAILCTFERLADLAMELLTHLARRVPDDIGVAALIGFGESNHRVSSVSFDAEKQIREAFAYLTDDRIGPLETIQRLFPPSFENHGTLKET